LRKSQTEWSFSVLKQKVSFTLNYLCLCTMEISSAMKKHENTWFERIQIEPICWATCSLKSDSIPKTMTHVFYNMWNWLPTVYRKHIKCYDSSQGYTADKYWSRVSISNPLNSMAILFTVSKFIVTTHYHRSQEPKFMGGYVVSLFSLSICNKIQQG
jgi:hypothetical protein